MDFVNNRINIAVAYDKKLQILKTEKKAFSIKKINDNFFIADFYGKIRFDIKLLDEVDFDFNKKHFCVVESVERNNHYATIILMVLDDLKLGVEGIHIKEKKDNSSDIFLLDTLDDKKAVLLGITQLSEKKEKLAIINPNTGVGFYVKRITDINEDTNFLKRTHLEIDRKIANFNTDDYCIILFTGNIDISSETKYISSQDEQSIIAFERDITNYINLWNKYNDIERKLTYESLKNQEIIKFSSYNINKTLVLYFDDENFQKLKNVENDLLLIGDLRVKELLKKDEFKEYVDSEKTFLAVGAITYATIDHLVEREKMAFVKVMDMDVISQLQTDYGYIACSLQGSAAMFKRRDAAKKRIIRPNPGHMDLKSLFTDDPIPGKQSEEKIFINYNYVKDINLTENQKMAIETIINTPDIAIIQGPPGTGKTTVINQAVVQLSEYAKGKKKQPPDYLLSGFRHETVYNLTDKVRLYGIPAIKIGDKMGESNQLEPVIDKYIEELNENLERKYGDLFIEDNDFEAFTRLYSNYSLFNNSIDSAIELLNEIKNLELFRNRSDVCTRLNEMIFKLGRINSNLNIDQEYFLDILYELPLYEEAYLDNKEDLLLKLEILQETDNEEIRKDVRILKSLLETESVNLQLIKVKRREMIIKYRPLPRIFTSNNQKKEILDYLEKLYKTEKIDRLKRLGGEKKAIIDYKDSLRENPFLVRKTLLDYAKVLGATNQQSVSKNMANINSSDNLTIGFDNVFIDEAATSSPLDLFIPMTLAKSKLVLVGDHKQLPHIVNEKITDQIEELYDNDNIKKEFDITLFEYLIYKAHELEKKDGMKRVVTLNNQFRMHPFLGDLVSKHFYMDEGGIRSPRPATDFMHNYHNLNNKCLWWIDNKGENKRANGSRFNAAEAELIAKHIREAVDSDNFNHESIAVITFYRAQVRVIKEACIKQELLDSKGNPVDGINLAIGTVDAFQGREFNIVYLATTYSVGEKERNPFENCRLNNKNLLCVALSRQNYLLIVVGDKDDYFSENAKRFVPSLAEINQICNG